MLPEAGTACISTLVLFKLAPTAQRRYRALAWGRGLRWPPFHDFPAFPHASQQAQLELARVDARRLPQVPAARAGRASLTLQAVVGTQLPRYPAFVCSCGSPGVALAPAAGSALLSRLYSKNRIAIGLPVLPLE